ncbi:energy transducer TonB [Stenotrophomonas maltophilia]|uniref:energy transducer TonB n=1 Tax=Stenotrophomonas maltophilia TaxID=40324 RepID=UPI001D0F8CE3|nr:energy transducer TonB [Stenotrophomonas maltophilia]UXF78602.1 energy transducer TonB [Stenotrophomonas maltophilia]
MPRLNTTLALNLVLMLLGATPAMAMAADPQVSTEVFVERGDNPTFELQQAPATPPDTLLQMPMAVLLVAQLDELGQVSNVMVVRSSGLRELDRAAFTAVDQWRFEPVLVEGVARHARVRVRLSFVPPAEAPPG